MEIAFGTKAGTLAALQAHLQCARILPLHALTVADWQAQQAAVMQTLLAHPWANIPMIVRSSARSEDSTTASLAGRYESVVNVAGAEALQAAITQVIASYGTSQADDEVLIQPMLQGVEMSGVVFSREAATGAPYIVINYACGSDTAAVTGGRSNALQTYYQAHGSDTGCPAHLLPVLALVRELQSHFGQQALDIEFATTAEGLYLLQVRPLVLPAERTLPATEAHQHLLQGIADKVSMGIRPHPFLHGQSTAYGVMPDWNPAEIIGIRPRPLALSMYADLVTDSVWAYQRNNYGYKNLRSFPLMHNFHGLPYIDVRVSFNSFVPRDIEGDLADRLVNYYLDRLIEAPTLHDKVEFEIIFSCYTLDLPQRLAALSGFGFDNADQQTLTESLRRLTNRIIRTDGLWRSDSEKIATLDQRRARIMNSDFDRVSRIYWLLEDCKRYGTLPFAGLARAGFIAVQMLKSLVSVGVLSEAERATFMAGLDTVSARMGRDLQQLGRTTFLAQYGHLRPGTYDILSPRYDEAPDRYFDWNTPAASSFKHDSAPFVLSLEQMRSIGGLLQEHGLEHNIVGLFDFIKGAIEGREYAKFVFTHNLSDAISLFRDLGEAHGFSVDDLAYANIDTIHELYTGSASVKDVLQASIDSGRERYENATRQIILPPLITRPEDVWGFHQPPCEPNFITHQRAMGPVRNHQEKDALAGAIVLIANADPGFDWIFAHGIAGFITAYGGANSHMAIRAAELGIPAVIGAGESLYQRWASAQVLEIDAANRQVAILR